MAARNRKVSVATAQALNEIESMLHPDPPQNKQKQRKASQATQEALNFIEEYVKEETEDQYNEQLLLASGGLETSDKKSGENERTENEESKESSKLTDKPDDRRKVGIQNVLAAEERILLPNTPTQINDKIPSQNNKNPLSEAVTCVLTLMFEELEHPPEVYEELLTSSDNISNKVELTSEQAKLLGKIFKNS